MAKRPITPQFDLMCDVMFGCLTVLGTVFGILAGIPNGLIPAWLAGGFMGFIFGMIGGMGLEKAIRWITGHEQRFIPQAEKRAPGLVRSAKLLSQITRGTADGIIARVFFGKPTVRSNIDLDYEYVTIIAEIGDFRGPPLEFPSVATALLTLDNRKLRNQVARGLLVLKNSPFEPFGGPVGKVEILRMCAATKETYSSLSQLGTTRPDDPKRTKITGEILTILARKLPSIFRQRGLHTPSSSVA